MSDNFANPQPPSNYVRSRAHEDTSNLTNDDFRKLLMTPSASSTNREKVVQSSKIELNSSKKKFANEAAERRKEKKLYYASLMKEVKEREAELAEKYRDRAKERRENIKTGTESDFVSTTQNFRSVAPDFSLAENADRRRQIIEESKFLGGDLEHTHLVKGLDYALLQKIKAELEKKQEDLELEDQSTDNKTKEMDEKDTDEEDEEDVGDNLNKPNLKPKIVSKLSNAAIASALTKSMQDGTGLKKYA
jgi:IK cytokine